MSEKLYLEDAYQSHASGVVVAHTPEGGIILDASVFYPTGGGQPGDSGTLTWADRKLNVATAVKSGTDAIALVPSEPHELPPVGTQVQQHLDWERRHRHMRMHTGLHLLSVIIPRPVTGGSIGPVKSRLDFDMPEVPQDRDALEESLNQLVDQDLPLSEEWITDEQLRDNPSLIKTLSVAPPTGAGRVRLIRIGEGRDQVDLQPCGGTHVARTGEIGRLLLGRIENKGRMNRRVYLHLDA